MARTRGSGGAKADRKNGCCVPWQRSSPPRAIPTPRLRPLITTPAICDGGRIRGHAPPSRCPPIVPHPTLPRFRGREGWGGIGWLLTPQILKGDIPDDLVFGT